MQDGSARASSPSSRTPQCVAVSTNGSHVVDLGSRSTESIAALENVDVASIEMRSFRFDKQLSLERLERLLSTAKAPRLQSLVLEDCVLTDHVVAFIVETFVRGNTLTSLIVRRCRQVSMTSLMALASLVKAAPLTNLELSSCHLARQAGILLGQALQTAQALKRINFSDNNLRDGGLRAIADGVRAAQTQNDTLDEFDCSSNGISATGLAGVGSVNVKRLIASENNVTTFPAALISGDRILESFNLSGNALSDDAMREILTQALQAPSLASLNIQNCGLSQANEEFLTKSLLLKSKTVKGCCLRELFVGDRPDIGDVLDNKDESLKDDSPNALVQFKRLEELKRLLEMQVPGLAVHLLEPFVVNGDGLSRQHDDDEDADDRIASTDVDIELETPRRQGRRELLERTEFMRRRSEELPLADDDESLASFVSDKLIDKCQLPSKQLAKNSVPTYRDSENDTVVSSRHQSTSSFVQLHHSASNASFFLNHANPSLDDVASQFSIDPPPSAMASVLQNTDVEFIVSRTIETMNRNFEQRLTQFLMRMEFQQQEKNATQLQMLAAKVEACERAIPRLEARLDVLADRIATSGAQVAKMQTEWQTKQTMLVPGGNSAALASTTPLTLAMQSQVDELVANRLRSSERQLQNDVTSLRREVSCVATATQNANPQAVVDAVSVHLTQFKQEFDANQSTVLRRFTENIVRDGVRVDERMQQLEGKVAHLEGIIQAEQHASLLALEAISEAFAGNNTAVPTTPLPLPSAMTPIAPVVPLPPHPPPPYVCKPIQAHGYTR